MFVKGLVGLLLLAALTACSNRDDHDHPGLKTGEELYNHHCAECHGEEGTGMLADLTPANILTRRDREGIINYITTNINSRRRMPVFAAMPRSEALAIATHLLKLREIYEATPDKHRKPRQLMIEP